MRNLRDWKIRGQRTRVNKHIARLPETSTIVIHQKLEPNPIDAYNRLKEVINNIHRVNESEITEREDLTKREKSRQIREYRRSPAIDYKNTTIMIKQNNTEITEEQFVTMVQTILDEKYEVENVA